MLNLSLQHKMMMKLSPQQVQYLKMLQLPTLALEQKIKAELEMNPLLEEGMDEELVEEQQEPEKEELVAEEVAEGTAEKVEEQKTNKEEEYSIDDYIKDDYIGYKASEPFDGEEKDEMPMPDTVPLYHRLLEQFTLLDLDDEEILAGPEIIGNLDEDGYLRRDLEAIVQDLNLSHGTSIELKKAESVLHKIQRLDPVGIGSRSLQECLIVQVETNEMDDHYLKMLTLRVLKEYYEDFTMRHFEEIAKKVSITLEDLKRVVEVIQHLNPKPGEGEFTAHENYVVPDFIVTQSDDDFIISLNDRNIPLLRINKQYKELMSKRKKDGVPTEAKDFIRQRFEAAKWFISSIHQRRETMLKVMRTIVEKQREFFERGEGLRPMIYKDISEVIQMDISTISRVVNSKFVQTDYGVFSLRHFFSDSISTTDGEEVSNKEVKIKLKVLIDAEDHLKPLSDDKLAKMLNDKGLNIARRTVAKYREAMLIPVARLRRKLK
ncbi:MAG: RNA polymerase factor sigma-54 [Ignavibacteriae bacterium]|nr:RNA polymerase factor sigma-54 [Ignavibacteriota bacterium]